MRIRLLLWSFLFLSIFTWFSYLVAKETFPRFDFDTTVKLQNHIPQKFDYFFSYFSLLGSAEITVAITILFVFLALLKWKWWSILAWSMIVPATLAEIFGKLVLFHPGPPVFFHRSLLPTSLPSFYVHTNFSYPSGHMTRTIFIITILFVLVTFSYNNRFIKTVSVVLLLTFAFLMALTRVYLGEHWFSDVLGGTFLGAGLGLFASLLILPQKKDIT